MRRSLYLMVLSSTLVGLVLPLARFTRGRCLGGLRRHDHDRHDADCRPNRVRTRPREG